MAKSFLSPIDMGRLEVLNQRVHNLGTAPGTTVTGLIYYDTVQNAIYVWNGTSWRSFDAGKLTDGSIAISALATNPLARANHTGTQLASTISDLATTVQAYKLNQFATPIANIAMGGFKFTGHGTPSAPGDVAEYSWVIGQIQSAAAGIASKPPVRLVTTTNNALSGLAAIDGVTPVAGDRILVVGQTTASQNGVYNAASGAWTRTTVDGPAPGEIETGALWLVTEGTANNGTQWRVSTTGAITVGTTSIAIVQFGASSSYTAANGVQLIGSQFSVLPVAGGGVLAAAGGVSIDTSIVARKFSQTIGDGTNSNFNLSHGLATQDVNVFVRQAASPFGAVECDITVSSASVVNVAFAAPPATNAYRVTIIG